MQHFKMMVERRRRTIGKAVTFRHATVTGVDGVEFVWFGDLPYLNIER